MHIDHLKSEIEMLSKEDFEQLRQWFAEKDWQRWDRQIEDDIEAGKLNFLLDEAAKAKQEKTLQEL